jgi:hypothetical protein
LLTLTLSELKLIFPIGRSQLKTPRDSLLNGTSSTESYDDLLRYTQRIADSLASIPNQVRLTSDDGGEMWKDLITLELVLHIIENLSECISKR